MLPTIEGMINPLEPSPLSIELIAWALSAKYRWGALVPLRISVASHSVTVANDLRRRGHPPAIQLQGLLHDACEAPLADLAAPFKRHVYIDKMDSRFVVPWTELENAWSAELLPALGCAWPLDPAVKESDCRAAHYEAELMGFDWAVPNDFQQGRHRGENIRNLTLAPDAARNVFLFIYRGLVKDLKYVDQRPLGTLIY